MERVRVEVQPASLPPTTPYTASISATVTSAAPVTSSVPEVSDGRSSATSRVTRNQTAMPIGTLTRKIQCQFSNPVSTPPSSTPTAPPPDITKPKTPIAFARSPGSVNRPMIRASATAETAAPPSPCTARPTTRKAAVGANAQATDATVNAATPPSRTRRLP